MRHIQRLPSDFAEKLADPVVTRAYFVRSTAADADALAQLKTLDAEIAACHDGKTPVMVTERTTER
ncbi:MAG: hypothetical protein U0794_00770 [Isosphaeraceae bacterium]